VETCDCVLGAVAETEVGGRIRASTSSSHTASKAYSYILKKKSIIDEF
jgi:hypothetical protein